MVYGEEINIQPEKQLKSEEVKDLEEGDRIAVYAVEQDNAKILIGTVKNRQINEFTVDPVAKITTFVIIDYSRMYELDNGDLIDATEELHNRPPYRHHLDQPLRDPPLPGLSYNHDDDRFSLVIPEPTWCKGRVDGYYPAPVAFVLDVVFGDTIWPEDVIPDDVEFDASFPI